MRENGFTLIELLAVIVILAVIALIATPIVLNIIEETKKTSFVQSANGIIKAAKLYYYNKEMKDQLANENVVFKFPDDANELDIKSQVSGEGKMILLEDQKIALAIKSEKYCITKAMDENELTIQENFEECNLPEAVNGIMTSEDYCIVGDTCENGTKVSVQVSEIENYDFYVINDENDELTLIMDRNIYSKNESSGNVYWNVSDNSDIGPTMALDALKSRTDSWTNLTKLKIDKFEYDNGVEKDLGQTYEMYARLPKYSEINLVKTENGGVLPSYFYQNLATTGDNATSGYWLSTVYSAQEATAWQIKCTGFISGNTCYGGYDLGFSVHNISYNQETGIRPVIILSK